MSSFAPLHNHTEYSALDGLSSPKEIAERCQCIGCTAVGITDHGVVSGHLEFGKVMAEYGIKPIYGCELYHGTKTSFGKNERDQNHLVVGALTDEGLRNVWRMADAAGDNFRYVARVNWDILDKYKEGVFCTSSCIAGLVAQGVLKTDPYEPLNRYLEIFKDNFFIEIHTYPGEEHEELNKALVQIATERGVPLVYATDAHFASPDQYEMHDIYVAKSTGDSIYTPVEERKMWHPKALYIMGEDEIREALSYLPERAVDEALANTGMIAEKVNAELPETPNCPRSSATSRPSCPGTARG
jgi:DNA polymerase III subunit alpha